MRWLLACLIITGSVRAQAPRTATAPPKAGPRPDWLVGDLPHPAAIRQDGAEVILDNGLVQRRIRLTPNAATVGYLNETSGEQLLRAVTPEARVTLDGKTYAIGGLYGQADKAYLTEAEIPRLRAHPGDFTLVRWRIQPLAPMLAWKTRTWTGNPHQATGKELVLVFAATPGSAADPALTAEVHYALYDNLPLLCKWVTLRNTGDKPLKVDALVNEILATPEEQSAVVGSTEQMAKPHGLYIESNYAFNNAMRYDLSDQTTHWKADSTYTSQVNYDYKTPCLLEVYPNIGPGVTLQKNDTLESIRTWELLMDSYDRERRGLAIRKFYRTVAPWTTQNPIFMHLVSKTDEDVTRAIDQCAATGYEAVILSFGSHCSLEDTTRDNLARWKRLADYAHQKHILIGGYSLFSSRRISDSDDVISPVTHKPGGAFFGNAPCYGSKWGLGYLQRIETFFTATGFDIFENDGPYPGDVCASTTHPGHKGLDDSQWEQMLLQKSLYHWCSARGIYVNAPDWYFLDGSNKIALGYREVNFSLPRDQQVILNRQNIYDGTWEKTPSMGWGFVPLTRYQGGGPEAVLEPLSEHLDDYRQLMVQYYGAGVQACYRGPRLYDTDSTRSLVAQTIAWYKRYRDILNADIIHLRRPDGRDWDGILHVDPQGRVKAFLLVYNPLDVPITRTLTVPLYYAGLAGKTVTVASAGAAQRVPAGGNLQLQVQIPARGYSWYAIQ
ncbi:MAG TPA: hypothetical protein VL547_21000 [Dinghuibacter sp.]|uniref:alpha-galactosidase n=1 Tax=Dinghuibacter sp. TaxID=2024697 RepID=UPI002CD24046|nr:alpha-galactosidase [Dinghuibacter sp.]HTJ14536.1 hypothetical protein [Dinghuibacter sp.]